MLKQTIFGLVFILLSELLHAQAHHYSQFYNSELKLNPALTGLLQEKWRVKDVFQYRNLHNQQQIRTNTAFFEYRWQFDKIRNNYGLVVEEKRNFFMGIGIVDERRWSSNTAAAFALDYLSVAFHTKLGKKSNISIGLQPGYEYGANRHFFDMNVGFVFGHKEIFCWQEDQFFKYQFGFSAYHLFQDFHPQTAEIYFPARQLQLHGGVLIEPVNQFNFIPNFEYIYDSQHFYNLGFTMFFFPIVHYNNYDRSRLGFHYKNTGHLCFSGGLRFFGAEKNTISVDCALSYDMNLGFLGAETLYKDGFEVMLLITPLYKCWSIDRCGN